MPLHKQNQYHIPRLHGLIFFCNVIQKVFRQSWVARNPSARTRRLVCCVCQLDISRSGWVHSAKQGNQNQQPQCLAHPAVLKAVMSYCHARRPSSICPSVRSVLSCPPQFTKIVYPPSFNINIIFRLWLICLIESRCLNDLFYKTKHWAQNVMVCFGKLWFLIS